MWSHILAWFTIWFVGTNLFALCFSPKHVDFDFKPWVAYRDCWLAINLFVGGALIFVFLLAALIWAINVVVH